jgi:transposase-like protein
MNGPTRTLEEAMNVLHVDCPWCAAEATIENPATRPGDATFVCPDCSVSVELAPDPAPILVARAA